MVTFSSCSSCYLFYRLIIYAPQILYISFLWQRAIMYSTFRICITLTRVRISLFTLMRIRIRHIALMQIRIRILLLIKVIRICDHWFTAHPVPSRLHGPPQILKFDFDPDPKPYPDPAFDSMRIRTQLPKWCGSGSAALISTINTRISLYLWKEKKNISLWDKYKYCIPVQLLRSSSQHRALHLARRHHQVANLPETERAHGCPAIGGRAYGLRGHRSSLLHRYKF